MSASPTRAVIYCRMSSDRTGERAGVERQERECRELAERRGWPVVDVVVDNDTSATARHRPGWDRLLSGLHDGRYDGVIAWHPDRFYRSLVGFTAFVEAVRAAGPAEVATVNGGGDLDLATATGRLVAGQLALIGGYEREHVGERVKASQRQRRERGLPMGRVSWGWQADRMTADPRLREALQTAANAIVGDEPASLRSVAAMLTADGVPSPQGGDGWDADSVRAVLRRPTNIGQYRDGREGSWEPLLTVELYARVMAALSDPARRTTGTTVRSRLLGGIARCAEHGDPLYARYKSRIRRDVYTPRDRQCCSAPVEVLDDLVTEAVLGYLEREDVREPDPSADRNALDELDSARRAAEQLDAELAAGRLDGRRWSTLNAAIAERLARAESAVLLRRTDSVLSGAVGRSAREVWASLPISRRSAIVAELVTIAVRPGRRGARVFDPHRVVLTWRERPS
jgi:site-specific DNA recombinase